MRIQIIGYSGSGKSTLAVALGRLFGAPVLHLDNTKFYGEWQEYSTEEQNAQVEAFLEANESWIIDGNYTKIATHRFDESDMTIFMDFGRTFCYFSAWRRYRRYKGTKRESCPCNEKFDKTFRRWLWKDGRTPERRMAHLANLARTQGVQVVLKNRRQANRFLAEMEKKYGARTSPQ
jgi:adenylate kinase family enzyme